MAKRQSHKLVTYCGHDGCREATGYLYGNREDYNNARIKLASAPWFCNRHHPNGENLTAESDRRVIEKTITCQESEYENLAGQHFWEGTSGFGFGDGWNAFSADFPLGTKIVIRTIIEVVLPD